MIGSLDRAAGEHSGIPLLVIKKTDQYAQNYPIYGSKHFAGGDFLGILK